MSKKIVGTVCIDVQKDTTIIACTEKFDIVILSRFQVKANIPEWGWTEYVPQKTLVMFLATTPNAPSPSQRTYLWEYLSRSFPIYRY